LQAKVAGIGGQTQQLEHLVSEVARAQNRVDNELKTIPETPDLAGLIRKLSQDVDRVRVLDQTFTAGTPAEAIIGSKAEVEAMPLTVDMESTFDSVFALIQNVESIDRLVRVSSVRIGCKREVNAQTAAQIDAPIVKATVSLEAIFEPPAAQETK
jgi:Tfp pilus assembly protein PilO